MTKIGTLGPDGTYCSIAAKKFIQNVDDASLIYYPTITETLHNLEQLDYVVVPYENSLDGYLIETIDFLVYNNYVIKEVINQKIDFAFVSNEQNLANVKRLYVQYKAQRQCLAFIDSKNYQIIRTNSNIESLNMMKKDINSSAIVPSHILETNKFVHVTKDICDRKNNYTRFCIITKNHEYNNKKIALVLRPDKDRPGLLQNVLTAFSKNNINLISIISRPTKAGFGKYYFFMEFYLEGNNEISLSNLISEITSTNDVSIKILGSYFEK